MKIINEVLRLKYKVPTIYQVIKSVCILQMLIYSAYPMHILSDVL